MTKKAQDKKKPKESAEAREPQKDQAKEKKMLFKFPGVSGLNRPARKRLLKEFNLTPDDVDLIPVRGGMTEVWEK